MAKQSRDELGFDLDAAIPALHHAALEAGAVRVDDPRARDAALTAYAHLHSDGERRCKEKPCRKAGLCLALHELVQYRAERAVLGPVLAASRLSASAKRWVEKEGRELHGAVGALLPGVVAPRIERAFDPHARQILLCERPSRLRYLLELLHQELDTYEHDLHALLESPELAQAKGRKPGALLLTAVWQHLDWGGFTYEEIFRLVPSGGASSKIKDIVRKRVKAPNARSLLPIEMLTDSGGVEKRKRRRSST
jgi:hypothetical protein